MKLPPKTIKRLAKVYEEMRRAYQKAYRKPEVRAAFQEWGRQGGSTRAKRMTKAQRSEGARKAALARWRSKPGK